MIPSEPTHVMTHAQWEITISRTLVDASEKMIKQQAVKCFNEKFKSAVAQKEVNEQK